VLPAACTDDCEPRVANGDVPEIAIIIATYKRARLLPRALNSIAAQTLHPAEIIVVDDASGDDSADVVARWSVAHGMPVRFIAAATNGGVGTARNLALEQAQSPIVGFLDSDDEYLPHALATLIEPLRARPEVTLSFADAEQRWADNRPPVPMMRRCLTIGVDTVPLTDVADWQRLADPVSTLLLTSMIPTCAALFRRDAAKRVGWMPTYRHGEDWLFWLRLAGTGDFACRFDDIAIVHRDNDNLTGPAHDATNARQTLRAFLALRDGSFGIPLTDDHYRRLDAAITDKAAHMRYHHSRRGLAAYGAMLTSDEARLTGGMLRHLLGDPVSIARALAFTLRG
jgi:glycosyltransferase involved in cell wall biosynthesis